MMNAFLALVWMILLLIGGTLLFWFAYRRSQFTLFQFVLDRISFIILRLLWRTQAPSKLPLEPGQGAVIVANHRSSVDPFYIHLIAKRRVRWMVAREFCENRWFGWFLTQAGAIPTRRGGIDNSAIRNAGALLAEGHWVGVLPEGRINMSDEFMLPVRPGAALIARRANVPILPVYIEGAPYGGTPASPFLMSARVRVHVGQPLYPADFSTDQEFILAATQEIAHIADQTDFVPQLAGRNWRPSAEQVAADWAAAKARQS